MDNWFLLYLLTRLDNLNDLLIAAAIFGGLPSMVLFGIVHAMWSDGTIEEKETFLNLRKKSWRAFCFFMSCGILSVFIPSKQDVFFIVGGSAIIDAVKSERAGRIGGKAMDAVEQWLDQNMPTPQKDKT